MKKFTLILATVALLAAGCSKTEVVGPQNGKGINFAAYTAKTTKAPQIDVERGNLTKFEVTAFGNGAVYFDNLTFKKSTESIESTEITVWKSDTKYFWPAFPLTFCAYNTPSGYATEEQKTGFVRDMDEDTTLTVIPATELAYQQDLVAAYAKNKKETDATNTGNSLSLTFNHYLTQVVVNATNKNPTYKVVVDGVKIANMAGVGKYTFSKNKMEALPGLNNNDYSKDYTANFTAKTLKSDPKEVMTDAGTGKWYLIPQSVTSWNPSTPLNPETNSANDSHGTYLALKVKITANNGALKIYPATGNDSGWMAVPIPSGLSFLQGWKYNVNIHFFSDEKKGAGYVDPEAGSDLDGDEVANDNGKKIIGGEIKFNAYVYDWDTYTVDILL